MGARKQFYWIAWDDTVIALNDWEHYFVTRGIDGVGSPPFAIYDKSTPLAHGSQVSRVVVTPRTFSLPLVILGDTPSEFVENSRYLATKMDPTRGDGTLRVLNVDGSQRQITCRLRMGLDDILKSKLAGPQGSQVVLTFYAPDPFWYGDEETASYILNPPSNFFPFFPLVLSQSGVFESTTITNPGDNEAWPVWTITGPGDYLVFRNLTTGYLFQSTIEIPSGAQAIVDTRPGYKTVKIGSTSYFSTLSADSTLWPLQPGANIVQIEFNNADANSLVALSYQPPYNHM